MVMTSSVAHISIGAADHAKCARARVREMQSGDPRELMGPGILGLGPSPEPSHCIGPRSNIGNWRSTLRCNPGRSIYKPRPRSFLPRINMEPPHDQHACASSWLDVVDGAVVEPCPDRVCKRAGGTQAGDGSDQGGQQGAPGLPE